jgi:hypothetical protein
LTPRTPEISAARPGFADPESRQRLEVSDKDVVSEEGP